LLFGSTGEQLQKFEKRVRLHHSKHDDNQITFLYFLRILQKKVQQAHKSRQPGQPLPCCSHIKHGYQYMLFALSYWFLAEKYYTVSVEMPYIELEVRVPKRKCCSRIVLNRIMITLNISLTLLSLLPFWITTNMVNLEKEVPKAL